MNLKTHESNLQERGLLEIGKSDNKKSASKLKVDLVYSSKNAEKAKSKRSKSKQKLNEIEAGDFYVVFNALTASVPNNCFYKSLKSY